MFVFTNDINENDCSGWLDVELQESGNYNELAIKVLSFMVIL